MLIQEASKLEEHLPSPIKGHGAVSSPCGVTLAASVSSPETHELARDPNSSSAARVTEA